MGDGGPFRLTDRVAVVTGAGSGIGRACGQVLSGAGAVVVCADVDELSAKQTADHIARAGGHASRHRVDASAREQVEALVAGAVKSHGRIDIMCNIAGIIQQSPVIDTDEADLDRVLGVNLKGVFFGCQAAAARMVEQGSGAIVNMSSGAIDTPAPNLVCYAMAKAAVAQLTKTLAVEVGPKGVRVNAVAPGFVLTGMTSRHFVRPDGSVDEAGRQAIIDLMASRGALGTVGQPEDIAYAVLYLVSDEAKFMTGQVLRPNGGVAMP